MDTILRQITDHDFLQEVLSESTGDYYFIGDIEQDIFSVSQNMADDFGFPDKQITGLLPTWMKLIQPEDQERYYKAANDLVSGRKDRLNEEYQVRLKNGELIWIHEVIRVKKNAGTGRPERVVGIARKVENGGKVDLVTGLYTHEKYMDRMQKLDDSHPIGIMLLGIDDFTMINTLNNHSFGDLVLRNVAQDIRNMLPEGVCKEAQLKADEEMLAKIRQDVIEILMPRVIAGIHNEEVLALFNDRIVYHVNPTGKFVIGGPHGDTGLTGRKIIVDTYGGKGAHGGGAFSGKDPSKVDRSAAYAARHIAKNMVAAGVADEMLVQVSYAIGVARPINIYVNTYGRSNVKLSDGEIAKKIDELFDLRPKAIEERLKLRNPIYEETASYGHMGREPKVVTKTYESMYHEAKTLEVELFTWEKLDYVDKIKEAFGL